MHRIIALNKSILILFSILILLSQSACNALKPKKVSAKDFPPDPRKRVEKNINEGRGFRLFEDSKKGTNYEFASANPLWRATLDTLDFMPLASANYSGGIVITDWYSENNSPNESVKISVRFLTNEVRADALDVKVFTKNCETTIDCKVSENKGTLVTELTKSILKKAAIYEKENRKKNFKPYDNTSKPGDNKKKKN